MRSDSLIRMFLSRFWPSQSSVYGSSKSRRRRGGSLSLLGAEALEQRLLLTVFQDFDSVTAPALPSGWIATAEGFAPQNWQTVAGGSAGGPNRLFVASTAAVPDDSPDNVYDSRITSPAFTLSAANQRLIFSQASDLEVDGPHFSDGGVLEIAVGGGSFTDILTAGGTFVEGGYNVTIYHSGANPLASRSGWGGNSNGYVTTTVDLPDSALGQSVELRWRFGADQSFAQVGWSIDSIRLTDTSPTVDSLNEGFDFVSAPSLPSGWSQAAAGNVPQIWVTTDDHFDEGGQSAFVAGTATQPGSHFDNVNDSQLYSPKLLVSANNQQLRFRQMFNFEQLLTFHFDGGVLEIAVDGGNFTDIIAAGGTFVEGGYNSTLVGAFNPLNGRSGWGGNSNGYSTTTVQLPDSLIGKTVQYRWRLGTDGSSSSMGWSIDSVFTSSIDSGNQISEAPLVALNTSVNGILDHEFDVDLFAFDVTAGQTILFDLDAIGSGALTDGVLRIFNANGNQLARDIQTSGPAPEGDFDEAFLSVTFETEGRYYVGISGFGNIFYNAVTGTGNESSDHTGTYTLQIGPAPTVNVFLFDSSLIIGETSLVEFFFSEPVTGFDNSDLTVQNGTLSAVTSSDGGISWTAFFTPHSNLFDTTNLITVNNTGYTDAAGNTGTGTTSSPNYTIDTQRPTVDITIADTSLIIGESTQVTFTFSEAVTGFTNSDLTVENGTLFSPVSSSDGGITWTATFAPLSGVSDTTNLITVDNTGYTDAAGNTGTGTTSSQNYSIDTQRPSVVVIIIADTTLLAGESTLVEFFFSEPVTGFTDSDLTAENGTLSPVSSGDGGITWIAMFTPHADVSDTTNLITVNNTGYTDTAGNTGTGTTSSPNYTIDTQRPTVEVTLADTDLILDETSLVTFTFSEAVTGFTNSDLTVENGTLSPVSSGDGGITWIATFTPHSGVSDITNLITVDNTGYTNAAGNTGTGTTSSQNYTIDTLRPTVVVHVASSTLNFGVSVLVTFLFSEPVTGFDNSDLTVENATLSDITSDDGGLTFLAMLTGITGVSDETNVITVDNTGFTNSTGTTGTGTTSSQNYIIDTLVPPSLYNPSDAATFNKKLKQPALIFEQVEVGNPEVAANLAGGTLTITIAVATNKKGNKLFDQIETPGVALVGAGTPQTTSGMFVLQIQLGPNATEAEVQTFLRGITFSTKGAGLKKTPRAVTVTLTGSSGLSATLNQTLNVRKK